MSDPRTVTINADAAWRIDRIRELWSQPSPTSEKEAAARREEVRSYAVEVVVEIMRAEGDFPQSPARR